MRVVLVAVVALPIVCLAAFPPARRLFPSIVGLDCDARGVCAESSQELQRAPLLYDDAKQFVQVRLGPFHRGLHTIFCQSERCASYFGLSTSKAQTTGPFGTVIGPGAWVPYLVRHDPR
jgi:hypothetical protein